MEIKDLIEKFSDTREKQIKAVFSTIFIVGNRLQTVFDSHIPEISLKQFMLLSMVRQAGNELTFTQLGTLLGCSRQNVKKLADVLEKKGYVEVRRSSIDMRAFCICPTDKMICFFDEVFSAYQTELTSLFEEYTDEEVEKLFYLMMKLYSGIDHLEKSVR